MLKLVGIVLAFVLGYLTASNKLLTYLLQEVDISKVQKSQDEKKKTDEI